MKRTGLSNSEYLGMYLTKRSELPAAVLLPHEAATVDEAVMRQRKAFEHVIEQKVEVTGGDDWHDGAFRATDNEAKIISQQMSAIAPFIGAVIVEYPHIEESRVTLGSRVVIEQSGFVYPADIVGFRNGYPEDVVDEETGDDVTPMSPESPLAQILMGGTVGSEYEFNSSGRSMSVIIQGINQVAVRDYFTSHKQSVEIIE